MARNTAGRRVSEKARVFVLGLLSIFVVVSVLTLRATPGMADTNVQLPFGYQIEAHITGLNFPTSITWDANGKMYVAEAGSNPRDPKPLPGRILSVEPNKKTVVEDNLSYPVTDVKIGEAGMYVAHGKDVSLFRGGLRQNLTTGFSIENHFATEIALGPDGWVYISNGAVPNSQVIGEGSLVVGWSGSGSGTGSGLGSDSGADLGSDTGSNTGSDNRGATETETDSNGDGAQGGQTVPSQALSGGFILRVESSGQETQMYRWGLRNPLGLGFHPDGRLFSTDWGHGDSSFFPTDNTPDTVLALPPHTTASKFAFASDGFDSENVMYLAAFGQGGPFYGNLSQSTVQDAVGAVLTVDVSSGTAQLFAHNKSGKAAGRLLNGFNHPIDAKFGPDGCLYVVDYGALEWRGQAFEAIPGTGIIWKICRQRFSYVRGGHADAGLTQGDAPWNPDYGPLVSSLRDKIGTFSADWGVFFKDLTSGKTFGIQEDMPVAAASTVKVPVVLYAANLVAQGKLSWNERLTYEASRDWRGGAGSMQFTAKDGDTFSIRELSEKAIRESDNVAWKMLERRLGLENIAAFMRDAGGLHVYPNWQNISTAKDLVTYMLATLRFAEERPDVGDDILHWLSNTIWNTGLNRFIDEVEVGHKEGDVTGVSDDVGVVYADHPYLIAIMSKGQDDVELGFERIGELSRIVFDYQMSLEAEF